MLRVLIVTFVATILAAQPFKALAQQHYPVTVTDAKDRQVTIKNEPKAILLGSGFDLIALSLVHPDPVSLLSGWGDDLKNDNPDIYQGFKNKFPLIDKIPVIGNGVAITPEASLSVKSDLAILPNWQASTETGRQTIDYLERLGIPTIVVDFNEDALAKTSTNMRLLGQVLNRVEQANAYVDFYQERIRRIEDRVAKSPNAKVNVLMTAFAGVDNCCYAFGNAGLGAFITLAGAQNVAGALAPHGGNMNPEAIFASNPDVLIATSSPGGIYAELSVGPGVKEDDARKTLMRTIENPFLASSSAVSHERVHGLWNFFNAVPTNILAAEAIATWVQPERFADINPAETLREINERFAAVPFDGAYWVDLKDSKAKP
jgi:iron complex transport system substrate-binding protein